MDIINKKKDIITITDNASKQIKNLIDNRGRASIGIRVSVKTGGCSGLSYCFEYADELRPFEEKIISNDVAVIVDPKAIMYIIGSEMDFYEDNFKSGFVFNNPNQSSSCGCGKSFSV